MKILILILLIICFLICLVGGVIGGCRFFLLGIGLTILSMVSSSNKKKDKKKQSKKVYDIETPYSAYQRAKNNRSINIYGKANSNQNLLNDVQEDNITEKKLSNADKEDIINEEKKTPTGESIKVGEVIIKESDLGNKQEVQRDTDIEQSDEYANACINPADEQELSSTNKIRVIDDGKEDRKQDIKQNIKEKPLSHTMILKEEVDNMSVKIPINLLEHAKNKQKNSGGEQIRETALLLESILHSYAVGCSIVDISQGPAVTCYAIQLDIGVSFSKVKNLKDDLKLSLAVPDIRIEIIPRTSKVGIFIPNSQIQTVYLGDTITTSEFINDSNVTTFCVGVDTTGEKVYAHLDDMPHLLIGGTTGSGKSIFLHSVICSLILHAKPTELKLVLIDTKMVELSLYNGIPHLLFPVITNTEKAEVSLTWLVEEMETRYNRLADFGVKTVDEYNQNIDIGNIPSWITSCEKIPKIVMVIDEMAELMMISTSINIESNIIRLAQMARAAGIYILIATQKPTSEIVTNLIKANMPSRIAFSVHNWRESRCILDQSGAEELIGNGDMLFCPSNTRTPIRLQGTYVSELDISNTVKYLKEKYPQPEYIIIEPPSSFSNYFTNSSFDEDPLLIDVAKFVVNNKEKVYIGYIQRIFSIGFNRAARIMDQLEEKGIVGPESGMSPRSVLCNNLDELEDYF